MKNKSHSSERLILSLVLAVTLVLSNGLPAMATQITSRVVYPSETFPNTAEDVFYNIGGAEDGGALEIELSFTDSLLASFYGNSVVKDSDYHNACGGAIHDAGPSTLTFIDSITGSSFTGNYVAVTGAGAKALGGAIFIHEGRISNITNASFKDNQAIASGEGGEAKGGAFIIEGSKGGIAMISDVTFEKNTVSGAFTAWGGAIYNGGLSSWGGGITLITGGSFRKNHAVATGASGSAWGGAIYNVGTIGNITKTSFTDNYAVTAETSGSACGGAIYNNGTIGDGTTSGITDTDFAGNFAEATGEGGTAQGGAIFTDSNLLIKADTKDVTFRGNYVKAVDMTNAKGSAIYINGVTLTLNAAEGRKIIFEDDQTIEGNGSHSVAINGNGTVEFSQLNDNTIYPKNAGIYGGTVTVDDTAKLVLSGAAQISAALTINSSTDFLFDFAKDGRVTNHEFDTINFAAAAGNGTLTLDADLATGAMDSITTKTTSTVSGNTELHVTALSLFNDAKEDKAEIPFTNDSNLKGITQYDHDGEELASHASIYKVSYDKETGNFIFTKSGASATTEATGDTVNVMNFVWLETVNNLQKRLGDLRGGEESDMAWARFQRSNDDYDGARPFNVSGNMYQVGYDFSLKNQIASRGYFGVSLEAFDGTQSYAIGGGDVKSMSLGAYYTKIYDSGHYFDFILRYGRMDSDSTSYDATAGLSGILTKLDYTMNSVTLSGEYGYRWNMGNAGLYLEPQAEFIYGYLSGAQATSSTNYLADIDSTNHFVTRLGLAFGQRVKNFNYYLRGSYYHDFAGTIHVSYGGTPYQQDSAQNWWEVSLGGGWNISKLSYFYAELTKHFKDVSNSLNFNVGFRFTL